ncbi:uncharacterized protein LOC132194639 [Neocloeon triangulifer]|uniref:uncharacterized protein LOC132194639 n=1 Tax=Neocloeon triangulifer TaxID=2078957 RepID=UPI00286EC6E6|nr:uncharacterized protein LOC132194639 [Neocloeon triangulifer]
MEDPTSDLVTFATLRDALAIAKAKRSRIQNFLPLRELAMRKIVSYDVRIESSPLMLHLPSCLKLEILDRMHAKGVEMEKKLTMPAVKDLIFGMLYSLLDASTKKFDFVVFSTHHKSDKQRDLDMWKLLVRKCPNLEQISDSRKHAEPGSWQPDGVEKGVGKFKLQDVKYFLLQLPNLQHMILEQYGCDEEDMAWVAQHFPNLITLGVSLSIVSPFLFDNLFHLQRLEVLKIHFGYRNLSEEDQTMQELYWRNFGLEYVKRFPRLRIYNFHPDYFVYAQSGDALFTEDPGQPHPLERITTNHFFDFRHTPNLTNVKFTDGIIGNPAFCVFLTNLRVLDVSDDRGNLIYHILTLCGKQLEELELNICEGEDTMDVCDIFLLCPRLHKLGYYLHDPFHESKPFNDQLDASHFRSLKEFSLNWRLSYTYASRLMALVLTAPLLERFTMKESFTMTPEVCTRLHRPLIEGKILQKLREFQFGSHLEHPADLLQFLLLLPVHAPRLQRMEYFGAHPSFLQMIRKSPMEALNAVENFVYTIARSWC